MQSACHNLLRYCTTLCNHACMSEQPIRPELEFDLIDRLNKALRISGKSTGALAAELEVHRNTISNYLHGRTRPDRRTLISWALATGVPLDWLEHGTVHSPNGGGPGSQSKRRLGGGEWASRGSNPEPTDSTQLQVSGIVIPFPKVA